MTYNGQGIIWQRAIRDGACGGSGGWVERLIRFSPISRLGGHRGPRNRACFCIRVRRSRVGGGKKWVRKLGVVSGQRWRAIRRNVLSKDPG